MTDQDAARIGLQWLTDHRMRLLTRADAMSLAYDGGPMQKVCKDISEIYYEQADGLDGAIARYTVMANMVVSGAGASPRTPPPTGSAPRPVSDASDLKGE